MQIGSSNNTEAVKAQYATSKGLSTRINFHDKYSTNQQGFGNWIVSYYDIKEDAKVLELGCGTGSTWLGHKETIAKCGELILTDFSEGMLETTKETLRDYKGIEYKQADIQNLPFEDDSFDVVIANMMLYHVPDIDKAMKEVRRVLKDDGVFYCATFGEHNFTDCLAEWFNLSGEKFNPNHNFTLQNGEEKLRTAFSLVMALVYEDTLKITDTDDLIDYLLSLASLKAINDIPTQKIKEILSEHEVNGEIVLPKEYGMFIAKGNK